MSIYKINHLIYETVQEAYISNDGTYYKANAVLVGGCPDTLLEIRWDVISERSMDWGYESDEQCDWEAPYAAHTLSDIKDSLHCDCLTN